MSEAKLETPYFYVFPCPKHTKELDDLLQLEQIFAK